MTDRYSWRGGSEALLRIGSRDQPTVIVLPALFEEANRMRRFTIGLMRALADRGIGSALPDLPGQGESLIPLEDVSLDDWRDAAASAAETLGTRISVAIRGGALLDDFAVAGWRLAPERGERIARDLVRATAVQTGASAVMVDREARSKVTVLGGSCVGARLYAALMLADLRAAGRRAVRVATDAGERDFSLAGRPLWRAAEPGHDEALVLDAADDIAAWLLTCG